MSDLVLLLAAGVSEETFSGAGAALAVLVGAKTLNHSSFYERYGWKFLCMVLGDGEAEMARMYIRKTN